MIRVNFGVQSHIFWEKREKNFDGISNYATFAQKKPIV